MTQISQRRAATRERLGDAALEVFAERGILAASVEEICERAGFTRGAFYSNYRSKDDLCIELLRRISQGQVRASGAIVEQRNTRFTDLETIIEEAADIFALLDHDDPTVVLFLGEVQLYAARSKTFAEHYRHFDKDIRQSFAEIMRNALEHSDLRWAMPEAEAADLLAVVQHQLTAATLVGETIDRPRLLRTLRPLLRALLVPSD